MIKIISFRHRLEIIICLNIILSLATCQSSQKFQYSANDIIVVYPNETTELVFSLTTASDEYLSEADLQLNIVINQEKGNITYFNIIYFNYQSLNGQECYSDWVSQGQVSNTEPCQPLNNSNFNSSNDCINYTGCSSQIINYSMALKEQRMYQNYLLIQNTNLNQNLIVHTSMTLELTSNNLWFYLGVGLTCLLLISLVIFTGIVFYWSLKYKRVKKMFEQFKLTEDDKND